MMPLLDAGTEEISRLSAEAENLGLVLSDEAIKAGDDFGDTLEKLKNVAAGLGNKLASKLIPKLQPVVEMLVNKLPSIAGKINLDFLDDLIQKIPSIAASVVQFIESIPVIVSWVEKLSPVIWGVIGALVAMKVAQLALNIAMLANPVGLVIAGIAGLIAIGILLWKNWDKVSEFFVGMWERIKEGFFNGINSIIKLINGFTGLLNKIPGVKIPVIATLGQDNKGVKKFAAGGIASRPSIFGEAGPEMAIPLRPGNPRSIGLLNQAARILGEVRGGNQIVYAPQIVGASRAEVEPALQESFERFKAWYEQMMIEKGALSF
jgi:phage-related protein